MNKKCRKLADFERIALRRSPQPSGIVIAGAPGRETRQGGSCVDLRSYDGRSRAS
jgi:hypothetical protein